jgi:hypothetical protein
VSWIDQSRRDAFEHSLRLSTKRRGELANTERLARELDRVLPEEMKARALAIGNELILPYEDALAAISIATQHQIAILGFESGEVQDGGFQVLGYNGYDFRFQGDWNAYVLANNNAAELWISAHRLGKNHGYVVTSESAAEFARIHNREPK